MKFHIYLASCCGHPLTTEVRKDGTESLLEKMMIHTSCAEKMEQEANDPQELHQKLRGKAWTSS